MRLRAIANGRPRMVRDVWLLALHKSAREAGNVCVAVIGVQGKEGMALASKLARQRYAYETGRVLDDVPAHSFDRAWRKVVGTTNDWTLHPKEGRNTGVYLSLTQLKEVS